MDSLSMDTQCIKVEEEEDSIDTSTTAIVIENVTGLPCRHEYPNPCILAEKGLSVFNKMASDKSQCKEECESFLTQCSSSNVVISFVDVNIKGEGNAIIRSDVNVLDLLEYMDDAHYTGLFPLLTSKEENELVLDRFNKNGNYITLMMYIWEKEEKDDELRVVRTVHTIREANGKQHM